jgi:hypothetical protein
MPRIDEPIPDFIVATDHLPDADDGMIVPGTLGAALLRAEDGLNRTQALVLAFFGAAWLALMILAFATPEVLGTTLRQEPGGPATLCFLVAISLFIATLSIGVLRRWRWAFWLILVAFLAGMLRVPASGLRLAGILPADTPSWYLLLQAVIGVVQFAIGIAMLTGYRRGGVWGEF